jgi:succinyldiaminopimelate transaminase
MAEPDRPPRGFAPPPYPFDRLDALREKADAHDGGLVELAAGIPCDPPADKVVWALSSSGAERAYPPSVGTAEFREAAAAWMRRRFGLDVPVAAVAACIGTKELVATTAQYLRLRTPERDTVLYPAVSYPTYAMGALLGGCRPVPVPVDGEWRLDLAAVDEGDVARSLCLWVNSPGNPAGQVEDLGAIASWARDRGVLVLSDECYAEFTWRGEPATVLAGNLDGSVAVHSVSKRSNLAGLRAGFYAGDPDVVSYLSEVRRHAGFMVPGPVQHAAALALDDDATAAAQAAAYRRRLGRFREILLAAYGIDAPLPEGGIYLWVAAPGGDAWAFAERLAAEGGALVTPGDSFGPAGSTHVRIAVVQPDERIELVARRLGVA